MIDYIFVLYLFLKKREKLLDQSVALSYKILEGKYCKKLTNEDFKGKRLIDLSDIF